MNDEGIAEILRTSHTIAVVGLSPKPERASYQVARYLKDRGYHIIPVNPNATEVLGELAYPTLADIPPSVDIDIVDVFRRSEDTPEVAEMAVRRGAKVLWLQLGIANEVSEAIAEAGGFSVIMNRCIKIEHEKLIG